MERDKTVIALGFFDGVHLGHGALLRLCAQRGAELGAVSAAFTFDLHPSTLLQSVPVPLLTTPEDRAGLMKRRYGIGKVIVAHYDREMMRTPWRTFVTDFLVRDQGAVHLVVGHDFHFGYKGEGDPQRLQELCAQLGIGCDVVSRVTLEGITVSSTYLRTLVAQGEMVRAAEFYGHPHVLTGTLDGEGRLFLPPGLLAPAPGTYQAQAVVGSGDPIPVTVHVPPQTAYLQVSVPVSLTGQTVRLEFLKRKA